MKRLLLLPILMLGFSLACDQPYEEIVGIKVGCPFKSAVNVKDYTKGDPLLGGDFFYKDTDRDQLFNFEGLIIVDGNIEGLALRETRKPVNFKDFTSHINEMEQSFGKAQISEDQSLSKEDLLMRFLLVIFFFLNVAFSNMSISELEVLADKGSVNAQGILVTMHYWGKGVPQNYSQAKKYYELAAQQGHATAQYNLGVMYNYGEGIA